MFAQVRVVVLPVLLQGKMEAANSKLLHNEGINFSNIQRETFRARENKTKKV